MAGKRHENRAHRSGKETPHFQTTLTLPTWFCLGRPPAHPELSRHKPTPFPQPFASPILGHEQSPHPLVDSGHPTVSSGGHGAGAHAALGAAVGDLDVVFAGVKRRANAVRTSRAGVLLFEGEPFASLDGLNLARKFQVENQGFLVSVGAHLAQQDTFLAPGIRENGAEGNAAFRNPGCVRIAGHGVRRGRGGREGLAALGAVDIALHLPGDGRRLDVVAREGGKGEIHGSSGEGDAGLEGNLRGTDGGDGRQALLRVVVLERKLDRVLVRHGNAGK